MGMVTDNFHETRLKRIGINIQTKFQDGNHVCERNTDSSRNDDVQSGVILNKTYYKDGQPLHMEKEFNPSLLYSFVMNQALDSEVECVNCGRKAKGKDFFDGCPYCRSIYTIEYSDKASGAKLHTNYASKDGKYRKKTLIKDFIVCLILSTIYCLITGRTFTIFDVAKILGIALVGTLILYYPFYVIDSYMINSKIKQEKEKQNQKQIAFWEKMKKYQISKNKFFNNLHSELSEWFFDDSVPSNHHVIDFDILDYNGYEFFHDSHQKLNIKVNLDIRIVTFDNNAITSKTTSGEVTLVQNEVVEDEFHPGIYVAKCHGCGASINILKEQCSYCGAKIHYLQSWYISQISLKDAI